MGSEGTKRPGAPSKAGEKLRTDSGVIPNVWDDDEGAELSRTDQTAIVAPKSVRSARLPALMVMAGSSAGKVLRIPFEKVTLGRSKSAGLTLTDEGISRLHCEIARRGDTYVLTDLDSTNGTLVNGGPATTVELNAGDRIQLGPEAVVQFVFYDEAEEGLANQLYEAATRDGLTRALNRRAFQDRFKAEMAYAQRHKEKLVAVGLDIDHFKFINDSYGHATGDAVLREVARAIALTLRSEDVFARTGGEEFVVLGRGLSLRNGAKMAERIRVVIEALVFESAKGRFRVSLSAGVAELGETKGSGEALLQLTDARLYAAKREGRNRVVAKG